MYIYILRYMYIIYILPIDDSSKKQNQRLWGHLPTKRAR